MHYFAGFIHPMALTKREPHWSYYAALNPDYPAEGEKRWARFSLEIKTGIREQCTMADRWGESRKRQNTTRHAAERAAKIANKYDS